MGIVTPGEQCLWEEQGNMSAGTHGVGWGGVGVGGGKMAAYNQLNMHTIQNEVGVIYLEPIQTISNLLVHQ